MDLTLVVLAAGMGSRYGGNKQLDGIGPNGEIIMDYSIHDAINAGFTKVVFIIRTDLKEAFEEHYKDRFNGKIEMAYAFQNEYICLLYTSPSPRDQRGSRMPSSA